ncbi:MAG: hypothetical protein IT441_02915 [Phycisphaeraceae bacterium]|nr:hypothetical protein [Phycisphaeraceae bacterium]
MRQFLRHNVPSQFHRRLILLGVVAMLLGLLLLLRLSQLTLTQHAQWLERAESVLIDSQYVPTVRGRILDRQGRVLAQNRPCFNIAVRYPVIAGNWVYDEAAGMARRANPELWAELDYAGRERLIAQWEPRYQEQVDDLWRTLGNLGDVGPLEVERRRASVVSRVSQMAGYLWEVWRQERFEQLDAPVTLAEVARPIAEHSAYHDIVLAVSPEARVSVERLIAQAQANDDRRDDNGRRVYNELAVWKQVHIQRGYQREYPLETLDVTVDRSRFPGPLRSDDPIDVEVPGVGLQIIGTLRSIQKEDIDRRPFWPNGAAEPDLAGYRPGDLTGRGGIEAALEDVLRGSRGKVIYRLDTQEEQRTEPQPGKDVRLSLDIQLQARISALMSPKVGLMQTQAWHFKDAASSPRLGQPLRGAAVVIEVDTGQILAAVSSPNYSLADLEERPDWVWRDPIDLPYINRAIGRQYQPGSTVKPLVLTAAVTDRKIGYDQTVDCHGPFDPKRPNIWRCWIYKMSNGQYSHGPLTGPEAIARSCNIFFYTMGSRLGLHRLTWWYQQYGLGRKLETGLLPREIARGSLPKRALLELASNFPEGRGAESASDHTEAVFMGIGQGQIDWTPLQAANAYAAIARGGVELDPTFIVDPAVAPRQAVDLHLDRQAVRMTLQGLNDSVHQTYGTTNHIAALDREPIYTFDGATVMSKSGTADPGAVWLDLNHDGKRSADEVRKWGDHAWAIALVQKPGTDHPQYAIAVLVEFGGSGGACAGPIVNQILYAMQQENLL